MKITFLLLVLLGGFLRLYKWSGYSFWFDEAFWLLLTSPSSCILIGKPPLFWFILTSLNHFSKNEFILRLLPFTFGMLSVIMIYKIAQQFFYSKKESLLVSFLLLISPFHIYYSQELTQYSLVFFLSLCSMYYLLLSLKKDKRSTWCAYIISSSLLIYTHYPTLYLLFSENIFVLLIYRENKKIIKKWLWSQLVIIFLYTPWLIKFPLQLRVLKIYADAYNWIPRGSILNIFQLLRLFNAGYNANFLAHFLVSLVFFPLFFLGVLFDFKKEKKKIVLLLSWLFFPLILSLLFAKIIPTFTYRNFIYCLPAYYLLIVRGIVKIRIKKFIFVPLIIFVFSSSISLFNYYRNIFPYPEEFYRDGVHPKKNNKIATKYITEHFKGGDIVIHICKSTALPYIYYLYIFKNVKEFDFRNLLDKFYTWSKKSNYLSYKWETKFVANNIEEVLKFIKTDTQRIWVVYSDWEPSRLENKAPSVKRKIKIKEFLDKNFIILDSKKFTGINLYLYKI